MASFDALRLRSVREHSDAPSGHQREDPLLFDGALMTSSTKNGLPSVSL